MPNYENKNLIFGLIFMLSNKLQTIGDSYFETVTTKQWFVLTILRAMPDYEPTLNELSEAVGSSHQNVKQLILKLQQKGYIELNKDEADARRLRIKTTPKCDEFRSSYSKWSTTFTQKLYHDLDENDLEITLKTMVKMKENIDEMENN